MNDIEILRGEKMKAGDSLPNLRLKLMEEDDPFNLDGYTVDIRLRRTDADTYAVDDTATIENPSRGLVRYDWSPGDTSESGVYLLEVTALADSGETATFPNRGYATVHVEGRL